MLVNSIWFNVAGSIMGGFKGQALTSTTAHGRNKMDTIMTSIKTIFKVLSLESDTINLVSMIGINENNSASIGTMEIED